MSTAREFKRAIGRPPAGDNGHRVKDYPLLSVRVPDDTKSTLRELSRLLKTPQWRVVKLAVAKLAGEKMPKGSRRWRLAP